MSYCESQAECAAKDAQIDMLDLGRQLRAAKERATHLQEALLDAQVQLRYWWHAEKRCPCGARPESPQTHPHVSGCPTGLAVDAPGAQGATS